jgi:hypothetical protein
VQAHPRPICKLDWGRGAAGGGGRWHQAATATGLTAPVSGAAPVACWYVEELTGGSREGVVSSEDGGVGRGAELGDGPQWSTVAALMARWRCAPREEGGGGLLNRRQGDGAQLQVSDARIPRPLSRRYGVGLGRRAGAGRGRGRTGGCNACGWVTSVGATRGGDGLQCALEHESSGPRRPRCGGWRATRYACASSAGALERQGTDLARNLSVNAGLTGVFFKTLN